MVTCDIVVIATWITIIGLPITLIGIGLTCYGLHLTQKQTLEAKDAAEAAKLSAIETTNKINSALSISDISKYLQILNLCTDLIGERKFSQVSDKLRDVRNLIIEIHQKGYKVNGQYLSTLEDIKNKLNIDIINLKEAQQDPQIKLNSHEMIERIEQTHEILKKIEAHYKFNN